MREHDIRPKALLDDFFRLLDRDADKLARRHEEFVEVACPFCGGDARTVEFVKKGFTYVSCDACASLFVSPRPEEAMLIEWATHSEAVSFWGTDFYRATAQSRREQIFRPRARYVADLAGRLGSPKTLLDIGAGYGLFLEEVRETGAFDRVVGLEPDPALAGVCRAEGFEIIEQWLESYDPGGDPPADFATAFEVLEHVFDPLAFVRAAAKVVRPGGLILFTTLAASGFDIQVLWENSRSVSPPQHLNFPSVRGLRAAVERSGLEVVSLTTPGKLDVDIVRNRLLEGDAAPKVPRFASSIALGDDAARRDFQEFLAGHALSSHVHVLARAPGGADTSSGEKTARS